jgi:hypothetical protein
MAGGCQGGTCGKAGQACCASDVACTAPYTDCVNKTCASCGDAGQRCCRGETCMTGRTCVNETCQ